MSESDEFRQYAEEALLWVAQSKTEEDREMRSKGYQLTRYADDDAPDADEQCQVHELLPVQ